MLTFPIMEYKQLKQAIAIEISGDQENTLYFVHPAKNGEVLVSLYYLTDSVAGMRGLLLPESLIIGWGLSEGQCVEYDNGEDTVLLARTAKAISSKLAQGSFTNRELFSVSHGIPAGEFIKLSPPQTVQRLYRQWWRLPPAGYLGLWRRSASSDRNLLASLAKAVVPFSVLFSTYLIISTFYTNYQLAQSQEMLAAKRREVGSALTIRNEVRELEERFLELEKAQSSLNSWWELWPALLPVYKAGAQVERVSVNEQVVTLRLRAESSSEILAELLSNPWVKSAVFSSPVRKTRNLEVVNIELALNQQVEQ
ncbi:hypothetical protein [Aliagarivorans taiwanensis]|uniref:hypothetical protein n=1 Tax=Aliagarivorans taiwanensis TaxID=561966 RepID=UPI0012FC13B0|nr:hypothetical protein [Aliagarivorans taiwanensis]